MRSLTQSGFRAWTKTEVAGILAVAEETTRGVLAEVPDTSEARAYLAGHHNLMRALRVGFELERPTDDR